MISVQHAYAELEVKPSILYEEHAEMENMRQFHLDSPLGPGTTWLQ